MNKPLFKEAMLALFLVFALNKIGIQFDLYLAFSSVKEYDSLVHFVSGACISLGVLWFYFYSGFFAQAKWKYLDFLLVSLWGVILVGFVWEIFELVIKVTPISSPGYFYDTFLDLSFDILGTTLACIYAYNKELKWQKTKSASSISTEELVLQPEPISASSSEAEVS